jgi:hypothetical protein
MGSKKNSRADEKTRDGVRRARRLMTEQAESELGRSLTPKEMEMVSDQAEKTFGKSVPWPR